MGTIQSDDRLPNLHWAVEKKSACPCGSGVQFETCCKPNQHLCNDAFSLLNDKDFTKAEIALRAKLTEYTGFIFRHTLFFIEKRGCVHSGLLKIDINAIEEIAHSLAVALQNQGKSKEIIPLFDHIAQFIPLPGIAARMAFLKSIFIFALTQNEEDAKKMLMNFKGLTVSLDEKLLGLYLDLFRIEIFPKEELLRIEGWIKFLNSYEQFSGPNPFEDYQRCLQQFQKPAGDDPRFSTFEAMKKNMAAFVELTHKTYKEIHLLAIAHIVSLELALSCNKDSLNPHLERIFNYRVQLWRRLNDAIAWQMLRQQQHTMRALCFHKIRGPLIECNPNSVLPLLTQLNADQLKLAIWTDSTSAVDIGDILIADLKNGSVTFAEVKEGQVNYEIIQTLSKPMSRSHSKINDFLKRRGKHGAKQMQRVLRQLKRNHQVTGLIKHEKGFDPSLGKEIEVLDLTSIPDKSWDHELGKCLDAAKSGGENLITIENCLWVWASTKIQGDLENAKRYLIEALKKNNGQSVVDWINSFKPGDELSTVIPLQEWVYAPARMPLCCRNLSIEQMMEIIDGTTCVLMAFDWSAFGKLLKKDSVELNWSSVKEGRQEKAKTKNDRRFIVGDRIVSISKGTAKNFIGSKHLLRIYFDGVRPATVAKQMNLLLDIQMRMPDKVC